MILNGASRASRVGRSTGAFPLLVFACCLLPFANSLPARTLALKPADIDLMAAITEAGPKYSWAAYEISPGMFRSAGIHARPGSGLLLRYSLQKIPKGQRITHAEWSLPVVSFSPAQAARLHIWRLMVEWGAGVNHLYRMMRPKPLLWTTPGARGNSSDRTTKATVAHRITIGGEQVINVTEDVELWYSGAAPNYGWLLTVEDIDTSIVLNSPIYDGRHSWELRITYEPQ